MISVTYRYQGKHTGKTIERQKAYKVIFFNRTVATWLICVSHVTCEGGNSALLLHVTTCYKSSLLFKRKR